VRTDVSVTALLVAGAVGARARSERARVVVVVVRVFVTGSRVPAWLSGNGVGFASVRGIFDRETVSVSPGGTTTFGPTHQYHIGLWFNDPNVPFQLKCEPGKTAPVVTVFNGEQHAGSQVLNTGNFPDNAGPLGQVQ